MFRLLDYHQLWSAFPHISTNNFKTYSGPNPHCISTTGLASSAFARHYSRNLNVDFFSSGYLDVSVPRVPHVNLWIQLTFHGSSPWGFPHSDICGSKLICSSPQLFAACHVLHRLLMPRHSPYALVRLNFLQSFLCCSLDLLNCLSFINK